MRPININSNRSAFVKCVSQEHVFETMSMFEEFKNAAEQRDAVTFVQASGHYVGKKQQGTGTVKTEPNVEPCAGKAADKALTTYFQCSRHGSSRAHRFTSKKRAGKAKGEKHALVFM